MMTQTPHEIARFYEAVKPAEPADLVGEDTLRQSPFEPYTSPETLMVAVRMDQLIGPGSNLLVPRLYLSQLQNQELPLVHLCFPLPNRQKK